VHEATLCLALLRLAEDAHAREGASRITALRVAIGELSGVAPEALRSAFPICAAGTPAREAVLHLERVDGRGLVLRDMEVS